MKPFEIKKILVPTDFSDPSLRALDQAINLAKTTKAEITLVHIVEDILSIASPDYFSIPTSMEYEKEIKDTSKKHLANLVKEKNEGGKITMNAVTLSGRTHTEIVRLGKEMGTDIIVMGTHGVSGFREFFVGSNTYRVVGDAECPVLSIQGKNTGMNFKKIMVPFNDQPHSREKVNYAIKMATLYKAELYILGIDIENDTDTHKKIELEAKQIKSIAEKQGLNCSVSVFSEGYFADLIIKHAQDANADLIVEMSGMERLSIADYFREPLAERLVNHSPIPVLSVKPRFNTDTVDLRFY
jgi:nucleotide-binding universal stress UspA family protein